MKFDFNERKTASDDVVKSITTQDLRGYCQKIDGEWVCTAFADVDNTRVICAISFGKNHKKVLREVMTNTITRIKKRYS